MKIQPNINKKTSLTPIEAKAQAQANAKEQIKAKIRAKFGKTLNSDKPKAVDKVELRSKQGISNSSEKEFGDVGKNLPDSEITRGKLKDLLKSGGFKFNDKERAALSQILK